MTKDCPLCLSRDNYQQRRWWDPSWLPVLNSTGRRGGKDFELPPYYDSQTTRSAPPPCSLRPSCQDTSSETRHLLPQALRLQSESPVPNELPRKRLAALSCHCCNALQVCPGIFQHH